MTGYWRRKLGKIADSMFTLKAGCFVWFNTMYESLTVDFVKLLLSKPPWKVRYLPEVDNWERSVSAVQWSSKKCIRHHMRKFWC